MAVVVGTSPVLKSDPGRVDALGMSVSKGFALGLGALVVLGVALILLVLNRAPEPGETGAVDADAIGQVAVGQSEADPAA